jgi:hypothetical protein
MNSASPTRGCLALRQQAQNLALALGQVVQRHACAAAG